MNPTRFYVLRSSRITHEVVATPASLILADGMRMVNQNHHGTVEAALNPDQKEALAKIKQKADYLTTVLGADSLSSKNRETFRELLALCGPLALQAALAGRTCYTDWQKDLNFPLRFSHSFACSYLGARLRMVLIRWLRQLHHIEWPSKKTTIMKLRGSCKKTAWHAAVLEIKNKRRLIANAIESNQLSDKIVSDERNTMPTPISYKVFRKSFEMLPEIRKTLLGNHFSHLTIHEQDQLWQGLMTQCGIVCAREPRYSNMTYEEVALALRKIGAKRVEDVPSKLYERLWRQGWFQKLRNDGIFAQYLFSAYGSTHRSLNELVAANYLFEIQAHKYVNASFDQPYPEEFAKQIGHPHIKSDVLITYPLNQVHIELAMYGTSNLKSDLKLNERETKYREMMAKKSQLGGALKFYDGLHTKFFEVPISLRSEETGKNQMIPLSDFLHNFTDILATIKPLKGINAPVIDEALIGRLKKNYGNLSKEREAATHDICAYFAKFGVPGEKALTFLDDMITNLRTKKKAVERNNIPSDAVRGLSRVSGNTCGWSVRVKLKTEYLLRESVADSIYGDPLISLAHAIKILENFNEEERVVRENLPTIAKAYSGTNRMGKTGVFGLNTHLCHGKYLYWVSSFLLSPSNEKQIRVGVKQLGIRASLKKAISDLVAGTEDY